MTIIHLSASPFPVSDAFWIRVKEVLASEPGAAQFAVEVGLPCRERCDRFGQRRGLTRAGMHALDIPRLARMRWQRVGRRVPRHRAVKSPPEPIVCGLTAGASRIRTLGPPATVSSVGALWRSVASGEIGAPERAPSSAISSARRDSRTRRRRAFFRRNMMFQLANVPSSRPPDHLRPAHPLDRNCGFYVHAVFYWNSMA